MLDYKYFEEEQRELLEVYSGQLSSLVSWTVDRTTHTRGRDYLTTPYYRYAGHHST